jgi:formate/nitrite transporter FocA (FNT family)
MIRVADRPQGVPPQEPQPVEAERIDQQAADRSAPSGLIIYKAIVKEGNEELSRPSSALFWSGLAAGLSMGASLITEALLRAYLPPGHWQPLVAKFGYCVGFLIVVLGRQQLFTENTITPVLPVLQTPQPRMLVNLLRLWAVVLVSNLLGGLAIAWAVTRTTAFEPLVIQQFAAIGAETMGQGFLSTMIRAVFAGWLIALMVWMMPFAEAARVWIIVVITYVVGLGHMSHAIAGTINAFAAAWLGVATWGGVLLDFLLPTLIGNMLGGVTLVAMLNHGQVVAGSKPGTL